MIRVLLIGVLFTTIIVAKGGDGGTALIKQQLEIVELKKQLNDFYNKKEKGYQERKKELMQLLSKIEKEKKEIQAIHDDNLRILNDIKAKVQNKTTKIYNKMKPKIAAQIFNQMINDKKIEDVFDIILGLKESNVTLLMRFLSTKNAATLTQMLKNHNKENKGN